ncbi:hypothetical protein F5Y13DRAFT_122309 [Hypoxylon sp. FL1857]|nr:hypothetical protein F5Y13DRAFT_122309 [Hypoxylon sp. FL1857]
MTSLIFGRPLGAPRFACHLHTFQRCIDTERRSRNKPEPRPEPRPKPARYNGPGEFDEHNIQPGEHVHSVCRKHDISFPTVLRALKGVKLKSNPCKLAVVVSERHCFENSSMKYLDIHEHPFAKSVLKMYIERTKKPLWYSFRSFPVALPFPCKEAARRIRHAFCDALTAFGYDREGRRITTDPSSIIADLYGTVRISCADPKAACNIKFAELSEQIMRIMSGIELALARDKSGRHISAPEKPPQQTNNRSQQTSNRSQQTSNRSQSQSRPASYSSQSRPASYSPQSRPASYSSDWKRTGVRFITRAK